jgi:hypothetical protein
MGKEKPPDRGKIVKAFGKLWTERGRKLPIELPTPYMITYRNWLSAWVWEIHGFAATLSIKQLGEFIYTCTGKPPKHVDYPSLCNEARKILDYALTIDRLDSDDLFTIQEPKLVSKIWGVNITEEHMTKIKKTKAPEPVKEKASKADKFTPSQQLVGYSTVASNILHTLAEGLKLVDDKDVAISDMHKRLSALSDAFAVWAGLE